MSKIEELFDNIKKMSKTKKILIYSGMLVGILLVYLAMAYLVGMSIRAIKVITSTTELQSPLYYGVIDKSGRMLSGLLYIAFLVMVLIMYFRVNHRNSISTVDERGLEYMETGVGGTDRWMNETEIKERYSVGNIEDVKTTIYGQLSENGEKVVAFKKAVKGATGGQNNLIIGSIGTGKSALFVRTELLQAMERGESFVVTDPSAELYTDISQYCRDKGADVKVLNLADINYSDCWNCLSETIDPKTERLDEGRLKDFVNIYMKNASYSEDSKGEEKFWYDSAKNILIAVIGYCAFLKEDYIVSRYQELYKKIVGMDPEAERILRKMEDKPFPWARDLIMEKARENGYNIKDLNYTFEMIEKAAPEYNIGKVYDAIMSFDKIENNIKLIPDDHPARKAYTVFKTNANSDTVRSSALQGAQMKMQLFSDKKLRYILSHDGITLSDSNRIKSAYFVILSDKNTTLRPISSLFFSFLINDARNEYNIAQQLANERGVENRRLQLNLILDEFYSIGIIGGNPSVFATHLSTCRKDRVAMSIIIQAYPQIKALYGVDAGHTIQNACDTIIFLGCNDPDTADFISKFVSGEATVLSESHFESGALMGDFGTDIRMSSISRPLLTVGEARRWKNKVLVSKRGEFNMQLKPFFWEEHPAFRNGLIKKVSIFSSIQNIESKIEEDADNEAVDYATNANEAIKKLRPMKDEETKEEQ